MSIYEKRRAYKMAGKTYELLFQLSAQLNGAFATSLQRAQTEFGRLNAEIKQLNQVQKDMSAYQKQQQDVEKLTQQLKTEEAELEKVNKEYEKIGPPTAELANRKKELEQNIEKIQTKLKAEPKAGTEGFLKVLLLYQTIHGESTSLKPRFGFYL